jgi:hypothetical protein
MQKVINVLALASFAVSASIVGAGTYAYVNRDALIESAKAEIGKAIGSQLAGALLSGPAVPEMPEVPAAGGELPIPSVPGVSF